MTYNIYTDGTDWIIGTSLAEAKVAYAEQWGLELSFMSPDEHWREMGQDESLTIVDGDGANGSTKTCAEWIELRMKAQDRRVCSTEY